MPVLVAAVALAAACGSRAGVGTAEDEAPDASAEPPDECGAVTEWPDAHCTLIDGVPLGPSGWPERVEGPTVCPASSPLQGGTFAGEVLRFRSASWSQYHSHRANLQFGAAEAWCGWDDLRVNFTNVGPGTYTIVDEVCRAADGSRTRPSACFGEHAADAFHEGWPGEGLLVIAANEGTFLRGSIDVVFADHCRVAADFVAPLCLIE